MVGEGEYVVYTSRQLRSKAFGEGTDFVWHPNSNAYCVQIVGVGVWGDEQNESTLRLFDDFKERRVIQVPARITALYEGACLGINCIDFYPGSDKPYIATGSDDFVSSSAACES